MHRWEPVYFAGENEHEALMRTGYCRCESSFVPDWRSWSGGILEGQWTNFTLSCHLQNKRVIHIGSLHHCIIVMLQNAARWTATSWSVVWTYFMDHGDYGFYISAKRSDYSDSVSANRLWSSLGLRSGLTQNVFVRYRRSLAWAFDLRRFQATPGNCWCCLA